MAAKNTNKEPEPGTVRIKFPKSREQQDDVFVSVNNRTWLIQRGVTVDVPECVAAVLQDADDAMDAAMRYDAQQSR